MYALRDATATVEAIPLIVASIISKKGAAGLDAMIIDVKVGNGAFMREEARARELAHALVSTGNSCGIKTRALLTDMNQPLGGAVGNSLEVEECINILRGEANEAARPVLELSMQLCAHMLVLANVDQTIEAARARLQKVLDSGQALECLRRNIEAQGGDPRVCDAPNDFLPLVRETVKVESPRSGFITKIDTTEIGHAIAAIGGGRVRIEDTVDPTVGFTSELKLGDQVRAGEAIGTVYCGDVSAAQEAARRIQAAYHVEETLTAGPQKLVKEIINE
jgi:thymidine phosphorylase